MLLLVTHFRLMDEINKLKLIWSVCLHTLRFYTSFSLFSLVSLKILTNSSKVTVCDVRLQLVHFVHKGGGVGEDNVGYDSLGGVRSHQLPGDKIRLVYCRFKIIKKTESFVMSVKTHTHILTQFSSSDDHLLNIQ